MASPKRQNADDSDSNSAGVHTPDSTDPSDLFVSPPSGFDHNNTEDREGEDASIEGGHEDPIESIIERKIADLKKLREVSPEEEDRLREKIRKQESGRWLEAIKLELVGKNSVPIEYFNRLVAENENSIGYVARHTARSDQMLEEKDAKIKDLQQKVRSVDDTKDKLEKCQAHGAESDAKIKDLEQKVKSADDTKDELEKCRAHGAESDAKIKDLEQEIKNADDLKVELEKCRAHGAESDAKIKDLEQEIKNADDLKVELEKCQAHGAESDARIKELEDTLATNKLEEDVIVENYRKNYQETQDLLARSAKIEAQLDMLEKDAASGNPAAGDKDEAGEEKHEKEIKDLQATITKLQADLATARDTGSRHYQRVQELGRERQDILAREQGLKNDVRNNDQEVKDLRERINELTQNGGNGPNLAPGGDNGPDPPPGGDNGPNPPRNGGGPNPPRNGGAANPNGEPATVNERKLQKDNDRLQRGVERLQQQVGDLRDEVKRLSAIPNNAGIEAQVKTLSDTIALRDRRIRELIETNKTLETLRLDWMGGVTGQDPQWWDQIEAITRAKGALDARVVSLYKRFGFPEDNLDGEAAITRMIEEIDRRPREQIPLMVSCLETFGALQAILNAHNLSKHTIADLKNQLEAAKEPRSQELLEAELGIFRDAEFDRRVDQQATMYRNHQEALLRNIVGAGQELMRLAFATQNVRTRDAINDIRERYLIFAALPQPKAPPMRY
ncbi:hypothetical protein UCREL1_10670 [Eutypa lata UCREL1]|uniref:Uncharacterized protein n=1 Tax=Eutypa lata (strain UCR-EL1) TaxID=1287681 RepID=M7S8D2_EUTLA|nr:hypothetical protein UCREL1_10670 [Eutypa lata UCREL1]